jgi:uncharacterized protein (UPF0332 family)
MDERIIDLSKYRMEKAKSDLKASKLLFDAGLYSQSLNRSYYSIFHAVRALLAFDKFDSKKHSGIIAYFNKNYINSGKFNKSFSKILMGAEKIRNQSDYNDFYIANKEDAEIQIKNAEIFIKGIEDFLKLQKKW